MEERLFSIKQFNFCHVIEKLQSSTPNNAHETVWCRMIHSVRPKETLYMYFGKFHYTSAEIFGRIRRRRIDALNWTATLPNC